jgi:hypothetical protein
MPPEDLARVASAAMAGLEEMEAMPVEACLYPVLLARP